MDKDLRDLLFTLPPGIEYTEELTDLEDADIPAERIPKLLALMEADDGYPAFRAALVLCSWGEERGFEYLRSFVMREPPMEEGWYPHRLRNYDDTYRIAMLSFQDYWARLATRSEAEGELARGKIYEPVARIFELSNTMPFAIDYFFYLVSRRGFTEYLPALKEHLKAIIQNPTMHHWKIADCAHLLMKFDPEFVESTLAACGKTLADFPNK